MAWQFFSVFLSFIWNLFPFLTFKASVFNSKFVLALTAFKLTWFTSQRQSPHVSSIVHLKIKIGH